MALSSPVSLLLLALLAAGCASQRPSVTADVPVASRYVYRGAVLVDDPVLQPALRVEQEAGESLLGAGLWSNFDLGDANGTEGELTEYDLVVDWSRSLGRIDVSLGAARYEYPHTGTAGSTEVFALLSLGDLPVTPTLELWYDCVDVDGLYVNLNVGREWPLAERWTTWAVAGVGWMDEAQGDAYFGVERSGLSDALVQATLEYALSDRITLSGVVALARVLDGDYRDAASRSDNATFALGFTYGF